MSKKTYLTKCTKCYKKIFYYEDEFGGKVFFEELGGDWRKHECDPDSHRNYTIKPVIEVCDNKECGMDISVRKTRSGEILRSDVFGKYLPHDCNVSRTGKSQKRLKKFIKNESHKIQG